jgi:hypothetical protein
MKLLKMYLFALTSMKTWSNFLGLIMVCGIYFGITECLDGDITIEDQFRLIASLAILVILPLGVSLHIFHRVDQTSLDTLLHKRFVEKPKAASVLVGKGFLAGCDLCLPVLLSYNRCFIRDE